VRKSCETFAIFAPLLVLPAQRAPLLGDSLRHAAERAAQDPDLVTLLLKVGDSRVAGCGEPVQVELLHRSREAT